mmetsp:Transcript_137466/g.342923  ORF Transcript_137466/g.342923 Transcript_137466/m.342923 type:complete len:306 (-) Transcript_137466:52-969(-)
MEPFGSRPAAAHGEWASESVRIALVGDSTLDNVLWVDSKEPSISEQLACMVHSAAICNLAADGFTSGDVLHGSPSVISVGLRQQICDAVPFDADGCFRPLRQLAELRPPPTHVVLSVGGNDVRHILGNLTDLPQITRELLTNYPAIVRACLEVTRSVILMWQYRPAYNMKDYGVYQAIEQIPGPGDSVAKLNALMEQIYAPIVDLAEELRLPIIDLPRTFDIHRDELYSHQIEPSAHGGEVIAALVAHVVQNHGADKPSTMYSYTPCIPGAGQVVEDPTASQRPWAIAVTQRDGIPPVAASNPHR